MIKKVMAAARNGASTLTIILIATLTFPPLISVGDESSSSSSSSSTSSRVEVVEAIRKKEILGSRPPGCLNKCMNCRPCVATLVIPPHRLTIAADQSSHRDHDSYYLLSWKCTCGDKLFQP